MFQTALGRTLAATLLVCTSQLGLTAAATAQDIEISPESVGVQIDVAGRQRMLTQRMAKSFCFATAGIDAEANMDVLQSARDLYRRSHRGLHLGDPEMGLFKETNLLVGEVWRDVDRLWLGTDRTLDEVIATGGKASDEQLEQVMSATSSMLTRNNDLVTQIRTAHAKELGQTGVGAALLIDLYGRQRMLSQKLAKEVCLVDQGYKPEETLATLNETMQIFDTSINAFLDGMTSAGVPPAPTDEIRAQLELAKSHWDPVKPTAEAVASGNAVPADQLAAFSAAMDAFLVDMNKAVGMIVEYEAEQGA